MCIRDSDKGITRQLTGLAAGSEDTDAVNVAQLKQVIKKQYINVKAGGKTINVKLGDTLELEGKGIDISVASKQPNTGQPAVTAQTPATPVTPTETKKTKEHTATFEVKGNIGGSNTFEYVLGEKVLSEEEYSKLENDKKKNVVLRVKDGEKVITNVANGVKDKDAVNVSQLNKIKSKLQNDVKEVVKKSDLALGGISNAVAIANLPNVSGDKKFNLAAAYGYYGGSHSVAIGFSGTNDKQNFIYKLSGSVNTKGNLALGIGAGVILGDVNEKLNVKKLTKKLEFANEKIEKYEKRQQETDKKIKELIEYKENSEKRIKELEKKLEILIKNK